MEPAARFGATAIDTARRLEENQMLGHLRSTARQPTADETLLPAERGSHPSLPVLREAEPLTPATRNDPSPISAVL